VRHYSRKSDANRDSVVSLWRDLGLIWVDTGRQGDGCPDGFLLNRRNEWVAVEIKVKDGKLKPKQKELHERVKNRGGIIHIVRDRDQALLLVGSI
jgi:hypothetical protein